VSLIPALLESATSSAIHLETRDEYMLDDPDWIAWRDGERFDPAQRWASWHNLVKAATSRGVRVRRARIVHEPVTDYVRYEYDVTAAHNIAAGEEVRWLARHNAVGLLIPAVDFWVFDGSTTALTYFAGDSTVRGRDRTGDPDLAKLYTAAFEEVWQRAVPHERYVV
jgi:uncharacterized protein DUF6879